MDELTEFKYLSPEALRLVKEANKRQVIERDCDKKLEVLDKLEKGEFLI